MKAKQCSQSYAASIFEKRQAVTSNNLTSATILSLYMTRKSWYFWPINRKHWGNCPSNSRLVMSWKIHLQICTHSDSDNLPTSWKQIYWPKYKWLENSNIQTYMHWSESYTMLLIKWIKNNKSNSKQYISYLQSITTYSIKSADMILENVIQASKCVQVDIKIGHLHLCWSRLSSTT